VPPLGALGPGAGCCGGGVGVGAGWDGAGVTGAGAGVLRGAGADGPVCAGALGVLGAGVTGADGTTEGPGLESDGLGPLELELDPPPEFWWRVSSIEIADETKSCQISAG